MAWLSSKEIKNKGIVTAGADVLISDKASVYGCANISIGNHVRIDDFCILSAGEGGIFIGNYVHIAAYSLLIGKASIKLFDFSGVSSRVSIYSSNDDYSGAALVNPTIPAQYKNVVHGDVTLNKHVSVGSGSVILPDVTLGQGAAIGALSLVTGDCKAFGIYAGVPAKLIKQRKRNLLDLERALLSPAAD